MTRTISLITATVGAVLLFAVPAYGDNWGADKAQPPTTVSPDWFERAAAVAVQKQDISTMLNARERALGVAVSQSPSVFDARSDGMNRLYGLGEYASPVVADFDRFTINPSNDPVTVSATSSSRDIEWPTIGVGLGIALALMLGLVLTLKATHTRPFAH